MKKKNTAGLVILGLLALCVILTAGVFMLGQSPKGEDNPQNMADAAGDVAPGGITEAPTIKTTPDIKPGGIDPTEPPTDGRTGSDIPLTVIEDKPEPPELPDTAAKPDHHVHDANCGHEIPTDPALTNPDKKPDAAPSPVEPTKPKDNEPKSGDKDGKGNIYIPGFGWVKDEGGGGQGRKSGSDGDWDKIIGH
jgi:hypothetical protein